MHRRRDLTTTSRSSDLERSLEEVWAVVASGVAGPQWYVDAAPFVLRGGIDRLLGGGGRRWPPPGRDLLEVGDRAGFWEVTVADHATAPRRLVLEARVRAPGRVTLETTARTLDDGRTRLRQRVELRPVGLLGAAYLVTDLPAREAVAELTHRDLVHRVLARTGSRRT